MLACCSFFIILPVHAFTANSLDITVAKNGDATATFRFTLEGFIENAIPQSMLEDELKKGLTTSSEPPDLKSMDRSSAILLMKKFADTSDVPTGTEYRTATMDFKKAEIALENSGLNGAVSADFSPDKITITFPDSYKREFSNVDVLPAVFHTVVDPSKTPRTTTIPGAPEISGAAITPEVPVTTGSMNVTTSPTNVNVYLDSTFIGEAPSIFPDIASGIHRVDFRKDGFESASKNVTIFSGKTTMVMVVLKYIPSAATEETSSSSYVPLLMVIIGLVVLAIGGYYYWSEKKKKTWGDEEPEEPKKTGDRDPAGKKMKIDAAVAQNIVVKDVVIKDTAVKNTVLNDTAVNDRVPENTIVKTTELKEPVVKSTVLKRRADKKAVPKDTVVRVSMLKDIPDKKTGDTDSKDTIE
jgi:flagellar basal body-associated protein FliL